MQSFNLVIKSLMFIPSQNGSGVDYFTIITPGLKLNFEMFFYLISALLLGSKMLAAMMPKIIKLVLQSITY